ncbi:MAG: L-histidine N(alpha)-methyltransferase [Alphaproteobacteria bacterium]|nr:L-histidine N(alpha)-methyltransferase [Alphaproteobacteria bacterium]
MRFLQDSIDFFTKKRSAHMGVHQYADHAGMRGNIVMSGAQLWRQIEEAELHSTRDNLFHNEEVLVWLMSRELYDVLPAALPVFEMGPGTASAFQRNILPIMMSLRSIDYVCVDGSKAFLHEIENNGALTGFNVRTIHDDFFENDYCYIKDNQTQALVCLVGGTIGNMEAPMSEALPEKALIHNFFLLARKIRKGWLLVSFDSNDDGEKIKAYYNNHTLFSLNVFDRMAAELSIKGDFDPCGFSYEPYWLASSGQLAHMAVVLDDMSFTLGDKKIDLKKNEKFHLKNSFKFSPSFFMHCSEKAQLEHIKTWSDPSVSSQYCLFKKTNHS